MPANTPKVKRKPTAAEQATRSLKGAAYQTNMMKIASSYVHPSNSKGVRQTGKDLQRSYGRAAVREVNRAVSNTEKDFQQAARSVRRRKKADSMARAYSGGKVKVK